MLVGKIWFFQKEKKNEEREKECTFSSSNNAKAMQLALWELMSILHQKRKYAFCVSVLNFIIRVVRCKFCFTFRPEKDIKRRSKEVRRVAIFTKRLMCVKEAMRVVVEEMLIWEIKWNAF